MLSPLSSLVEVSHAPLLSAPPLLLGYFPVFLTLHLSLKFSLSYSLWWGWGWGRGESPALPDVSGGTTVYCWSCDMPLDSTKCSCLQLVFCVSPFSWTLVYSGLHCAYEGHCSCPSIIMSVVDRGFLVVFDGFLIISLSFTCMLGLQRRRSRRRRVYAKVPRSSPRHQVVSSIICRTQRRLM